MESKFERYVIVQFSGYFNMFTEASMAMEVAELSQDDYWYIIEHYSELKEQYPETWKMARDKGTRRGRNAKG